MSSKVKSFKAKELLFTPKATVKPDLTDANLAFGHVSTDYMVSIYHDGERGWMTPEIKPFSPIQVHPFNSTLHYGLCAFEGMKAYKGVDGSIRLFRPMENMKRFLLSNERLAFPSFSPKELLSIIETYVKTEQHWIPNTNFSTLYIRPFSFSMTNVLGVHKAPDSQLLVVACPVGPYFKGDINLSVYEDYWRGSPKSAASYKIGANYAPTVLISDQLSQKGYSQAVWVYNDKFLESGATNLFFVIQTKPDQFQIVTPPLDGSILPGITRDSILKLTHNLLPNVTIVERDFTISEFIKLYSEGKLKEIFVSGTASVIGEVKSLEIRGQVYQMNYSEDEELICLKIKKHILDIQFGVIEHSFSHIIQ